MRRHATTAALFLLLFAVGALLAAALLPSPAAATVTRPPAATAAPSALLAELAPSADLSEETAAALTAAADRVCEGMTAGVPLMEMADALSAELGLTDVEAHELVRTAAQTVCSPPAAPSAPLPASETAAHPSAPVATPPVSAVTSPPASSPEEPAASTAGDQLPEEVIGRQIDCPDGVTVGTVTDVEGTVDCTPAA